MAKSLDGKAPITGPKKPIKPARNPFAVTKPTDDGKAPIKGPKPQPHEFMDIQSGIGPGRNVAGNKTVSSTSDPRKVVGSGVGSKNTQQTNPFKGLADSRSPLKLNPPIPAGGRSDTIPKANNAPVKLNPPIPPGGRSDTIPKANTSPLKLNPPIPPGGRSDTIPKADVIKANNTPVKTPAGAATQATPTPTAIRPKSNEWKDIVKAYFPKTGGDVYKDGGLVRGGGMAQRGRGRGKMC